MTSFDMNTKNKKEWSSFYSNEELVCLGLSHFGKNVLLSRKISLYHIEKISLGDNVRIDDFCILSGSIEIGNFVHVAAYCGLFGSEGILLADYSGLSSRVTIYTVTDNYEGNGLTNPTIPEIYKHQTKGHVILEKHVIVGAGSVILPNVNIGVGAAIGTLSLVNQDCEPWTIYAGIPVKKIKARQRDIILNYQKRIEDEKNAD